MAITIANGRPGAWIGALVVIICLIGCQPQVYRTPPLPPPLPPVASLPPPVRPTFYVSINHLNLRTCPGMDCPTTSTLDLNTEVEKLGEVENWTQIKVKKDGTVGYVSSRYLSPQPVKVARAKKKPRKAKSRKASQPPKAVGEEEAGPKKEELSPPLPPVM